MVESEYVVRSYKSGDYAVFNRSFPFFEHTVRVFGKGWTCNCLSFRLKNKYSIHFVGEYCIHINIIRDLVARLNFEHGGEWETIYHLMCRNEDLSKALAGEKDQ